MKRLLCCALCVALAWAFTVTAFAYRLPPFDWQEEFERRRADADHHDELFYYDADGNVLCPAEGVVCAYGPHQGPHPTFEPGDLVHDGEINAKDALQVLKISVGVLYNWGKGGKPWWEIESWRSGKLCCHTETEDVNHDGHCDAKDALLILQYAVGKIDSFPAQTVTSTDA